MDDENLRDCIQKGDHGVYLDINVSTESSANRIKEINPWRDDLEVDVKERAEKGKANRSLLALLADILSVPESDLEIVQGKRSNQKRIFIVGMDEEKFISKMSEKVGRK